MHFANTASCFYAFLNNIECTKRENVSKRVQTGVNENGNIDSWMCMPFSVAANVQAYAQYHLCKTCGRFHSDIPRKQLRNEE